MNTRVVISEPANATWSVNDVSGESEGVYVCIATNTAGSNSASTYLDVTGEFFFSL